MTLPEAIHLFSDINMTQPPDKLLHATYHDLFNFFAYKLLVTPEWNTTDASIDYYYLSSLGVSIDSIL